MRGNMGTMKKNIMIPVTGIETLFRTKAKRRKKTTVKKVMSLRV